MISKNILKFVLLLPVLLTFSCKTVKIDIAKNYSDGKGKKLDVREYLDGDLEGWGIIQDNKNILIKKFTVNIKGSWDGNRGVIKRQFTFDDGKKDSITWLITVNDKNNYTVIGHDLKGEGKGQQYGEVSKLAYDIIMPIDGKKQKITIEDVTYSVDKESFISISSLTKSGLANKGQIVMSLKKIDTEQSSIKNNNTKSFNIIKTPSKETDDNSKNNTTSLKSNS